MVDEQREPRWHSYEPRQGHGLARDPLRAILGPRPIGWISSLSAAGIPNLAPYSFFSMLCDKPPILCFSSIGEKDSLANVRATGEFVFNLATRRHAEAMNETSRPSPADDNEFEAAGLVAASSTIVRCPRVADAPVAMECKMVDIIRLRGADGTDADAWLTLGEIVAVHIDTLFLTEGRFNTGAAAIILRAGYAADYFEVLPDGHFLMRRPAA